jgi:hypothetical protein
MRVDSAGNVGIGTTSPAARLDVRRTNTYAVFCDSVFVTAAFGPREANDGFCTVTHSWTTLGSGNYWQTDYSTGGYQLSRQVGATRTEMMTVLSSGNVGIGTASPAANLEVAASVPQVRVSSTGGATGQLLSDGSSFYVGPTGAHSLRLQTNGVTRAFINSTGNVGIGTTDPTARLHVTGGTITTDDGAINPRSIGPETIIEFTGNRTLALSDASRLLVYTGTTAVSVTVPADSSVNFPVGTRIRVIHANATGEMTFLPFQSSTPTIRVFGSMGPFSKYVMGRQPGEATLTKIGANLWVLTGEGQQG